MMTRRLLAISNWEGTIRLEIIMAGMATVASRKRARQRTSRHARRCRYRLLAKRLIHSLDVRWP